jgi:hypothetical protein
LPVNDTPHQRPDLAPADASRAPGDGFVAILLIFLRLGLTSFGGLIAHIGPRRGRLRAKLGSPGSSRAATSTAPSCRQRRRAACGGKQRRVLRGAAENRAPGVGRLPSAPLSVQVTKRRIA